MEFRNPAGLHAPLAAYSQQAEVGPGARWLVLSGQVGMDAAGNIPDGTIAQTAQAMDNILLNLRAAGMGPQCLAKLVFYFVGTHDVAARRRVLAEKLDGHAPCMTVLFVAGLANPALTVEIDAWACEP